MNLIQHMPEEKLLYVGKPAFDIKRQSISTVTCFPSLSLFCILILMYD